MALYVKDEEKEKKKTLPLPTSDSFAENFNAFQTQAQVYEATGKPTKKKDPVQAFNQALVGMDDTSVQVAESIAPNVVNNNVRTIAPKQPTGVPVMSSSDYVGLDNDAPLATVTTDRFGYVDNITPVQRAFKNIDFSKPLNDQEKMLANHAIESFYSKYQKESPSLFNPAGGYSLQTRDQIEKDPERRYVQILETALNPLQRIGSSAAQGVLDAFGGTENYMDLIEAVSTPSVQNANISQEEKNRLLGAFDTARTNANVASQISPVARQMGNMAGNILLMSTLAKAISPAITSAVAKTALPKAVGLAASRAMTNFASFAGSEALRNAGYAIKGSKGGKEYTWKDLLGDTSVSGLAGALGAVASTVAGTGLGAILQKYKLTTPFAYFTKSTLQNLAGASTNIGVRAAFGETDKEQLGQQFVTAFLFSLIESGLETSSAYNANKGYFDAQKKSLEQAYEKWAEIAKANPDKRVDIANEMFIKANDLQNQINEFWRNYGYTFVGEEQGLRELYNALEAMKEAVSAPGWAVDNRIFAESTNLPATYNPTLYQDFLNEYNAVMGTDIASASVIPSNNFLPLPTQTPISQSMNQALPISSPVAGPGSATTPPVSMGFSTSMPIQNFLPNQTRFDPAPYMEAIESAENPPSNTAVQEVQPQEVELPSAQVETPQTPVQVAENPPQIASGEVDPVVKESINNLIESSSISGSYTTSDGKQIVSTGTDELLLNSPIGGIKEGSFTPSAMEGNFKTAVNLLPSEEYVSLDTSIDSSALEDAMKNIQANKEVQLSENVFLRDEQGEKYIYFRDDSVVSPRYSASNILNMMKSLNANSIRPSINENTNLIFSNENGTALAFRKKGKPFVKGITEIPKAETPKTETPKAVTKAEAPKTEVPTEAPAKSTAKLPRTSVRAATRVLKPYDNTQAGIYSLQDGRTVVFTPYSAVTLNNGEGLEELQKFDLGTRKPDAIDNIVNAKIATTLDPNPANDSWVDKKELSNIVKVVKSSDFPYNSGIVFGKDNQYFVYKMRGDSKQVLFAFKAGNAEEFSSPYRADSLADSISLLNGDKIGVSSRADKMLIGGNENGEFFIVPYKGSSFNPSSINIHVLNSDASVKPTNAEKIADKIAQYDNGMIAKKDGKTIVSDGSVYVETDEPINLPTKNEEKLERISGKIEELFNTDAKLSTTISKKEFVEALKAVKKKDFPEGEVYTITDKDGNKLYFKKLNDSVTVRIGESYVRADYVRQLMNLLPDAKIYSGKKLEPVLVYSKDPSNSNRGLILPINIPKPFGGEETKPVKAEKSSSDKSVAVMDNWASPYLTEQWRTERNADGKDGEVMDLTDLVKLLSHNLDVNVSKGRINERGVLGLFTHNDRGIKLKNANDLPTLAHEIGHMLDKRYGIRDSKFSKEVRDELIENLSGGMKINYPKNKWATEGWAEFIREFMTNKDATMNKYPEATDALLKSLPPKAMEDFLYLSDEVNRYLSKATTADRIVNREKSVRDPRTWNEKIKAWSDRFSEMWVTKWTGIKNLDEEMGTNIRKYASNLAYAENVGASAVVNAVVDLNGRFVGPSLKTALDGVNVDDPKEYQAFGDYLTVELAPYIIAEGKQVYGPQFDDADYLKKRRDEIVKEHPNFPEVAEKVYQYITDMEQTFLVDTGLISQSDFNKLRANYDGKYVPMNRVIEKSRGGTPRSLMNQPKAIKRRKGSMRDIINPIDSLMSNTIDYVNLGMRNNVLRMMANYAEETKLDASFMEKNPEPVRLRGTNIMADKQNALKKLYNLGLGEEIKGIADELINLLPDTIFRTEAGSKYSNEVIIFRGGNPEYWRINDGSLLRSLSQMSQNSQSVVLQTYGRISKWMTANITGNNILWALVSNAPRDFVDALVKSKFNRLDLIKEIFKSYAGMVTPYNNSSIYHQEWLSQGGGRGQSLYTADRQMTKKMRERLIQKRKALDYINPLNWMEWIADTIENGPREATYVLAREAGYEPQLAFYEAMDITTNFRDGGIASQEINKIVPFFNAGIRGLDRFIRWLTADDTDFTGTKEERQSAKKKTATSRIITFVVASAAVAAFETLINTMDEKKKKEYNMLSNYIKYSFFNIPVGAGEYLSLPKPRELAAMESGFGAIMEYAVTGNKGVLNAEDYLSYASDVFLPGVASDIVQIPTQGVLESATGAIGSMGIIGVFSYLVANRDFRGVPIVPPALEKLPNAEQYNAGTSKLAKYLGQVLDMSPIKLDFFAKSVLSNFWEWQRALFPVGEERQDVTLGIKNKLIKDYQYSNDLVNWLYDSTEESEKKKNSSKATAKEELDYRRYKNLQQKYSRFNSLVKDQEETDDIRNAKEAMLTEIYEYRKSIIDGDGYLTPQEKFLYSYIEESENFDAFPKVMNKYIKVGDEKKDLTAEQYLRYQGTYNDVFWTNVELLKGSVENGLEKEKLGDLLTNINKLAQDVADGDMLEATGLINEDVLEASSKKMEKNLYYNSLDRMEKLQAQSDLARLYSYEKMGSGSYSSNPEWVDATLEGKKRGYDIVVPVVLMRRAADNFRAGTNEKKESYKQIDTLKWLVDNVPNDSDRRYIWTEVNGWSSKNYDKFMEEYH